MDFLFAVALALLFTYAMSWVGVFVGQLVPTVEVAQQVAFTVIFPITSCPASSCPSRRCRGGLPFAEWNSVTTLTAGLRDLFGNPNPYLTDGFLSEHPILLTVIWVVVIVAIFAR